MVPPTPESISQHHPGPFEAGASVKSPLRIGQEHRGFNDAVGQNDMGVLLQEILIVSKRIEIFHYHDYDKKEICRPVHLLFNAERRLESPV